MYIIPCYLTFTIELEFIFCCYFVVLLEGVGESRTITVYFQLSIFLNLQSLFTDRLAVGIYDFFYYYLPLYRLTSGR